MHRSLTLRNAIAVITMAIASLCGGGKAVAEQKGTLSIVEVRGNATLRPDAHKRPTADLARSGAEVLLDTVREEKNLIVSDVIGAGFGEQGRVASPVVGDTVSAASIVREPILGGSGQMSFSSVSAAGAEVLVRCLTVPPETSQRVVLSRGTGSRPRAPPS